MEELKSLKLCDRCGNVYNNSAIQKCIHKKVNETYGKHICIYCCRKCINNIMTEYGHQMCALKQKE